MVYDNIPCRRSQSISTQRGQLPKIPPLNKTTKQQNPVFFLDHFCTPLSSPFKPKPLLKLTQTCVLILKCVSLCVENVSNRCKDVRGCLVNLCHSCIVYWVWRDHGSSSWWCPGSFLFLNWPSFFFRVWSSIMYWGFVLILDFTYKVENFICD